MSADLVGVVREMLPDREVPDELGAMLVERIATAAAAWPSFVIQPESLARAIAARLGVDLPADRALAGLHVEDLYLARGCASGDPAALAAFEASCGPVIERAIASSGATPAERADLGQVVRERLLVSSDGEPRIATYSARGTLASWVRVVAIRETARMLPRTRREVAAEDEELAALIAPGDDPELDYLKGKYREEFKRAFETAVEALDDRDRLVLRQHALDGLGIDQLAALHRVHRATAARWVEAARRELLASARRELAKRLDIGVAELDSVMRLIRSKLDLSLRRLLGK